MDFFDQIYKKLFPGNPKNEVLVYEPIQRKADYLEDYNRWKKSFRRIDTIQQVAQSYALKEKGFVGEPDVHLLNTQRSNGFAISFNERLDQSEFQYLFDWLAEKVEALSYKRSNSDITITSKKDLVETIEKHYLKPVQSGEASDPLEQQYGNVLIEHISVNDRPSYIKLVANNYSDRNYKEADQFEHLARYLFGT